MYFLLRQAFWQLSRRGAQPDDYRPRLYRAAAEPRLGLLYYQARYYVPSIGRFASADMIVPNPTNPQSYNRYSYMRNNPLGYRDPTGHYECQANGICVDAITTLPPSPLPKPPTPLIKFDGHDGHTWTAAERTAVNAGAWQVA